MPPPVATEWHDHALRGADGTTSAQAARSRKLDHWVGARPLLKWDSMRKLGQICLILSAIGAINWGLVGIFRWNLVDAILGGGAFETTSAASRVVYVLVGLAGVGLLAFVRTLREPRTPTGQPRSTFDRQHPAPTS